MNRLIAMVLVVSGCAADVEDVGLDVEELTTNNSCLRSPSQIDGCSRGPASGNFPVVSSIASDPSPKRACLRGYLKLRTNELFTCPTADGQGDKCYNGPQSAYTYYERAEGCFDLDSGRRECRIFKHGNGGGSVREAWMQYDSRGCDVFKEGSSAPTWHVDFRNNSIQ